MIQANELRVGNLLKAWFNTNNGFEQTVIGISPMVINEIYHGVTDYEPIPITEEWLLRFGFEFIKASVGDNYYRLLTNEFNFEWWQNRISFEDISLECNYIHQLQNYHFALNGEELKLQDK